MKLNKYVNSSDGHFSLYFFHLFAKLSSLNCPPDHHESRQTFCLGYREGQRVPVIPKECAVINKLVNLCYLSTIDA